MKQIVWFLVCTFALTYLSHGTLAYVTASNYLAFNSFVGQSLFIIGGSSPTIFALIFVFKQRDNNVKNAFKKNLFSYKHPIPYWLYAIGIPIVLGGIFQLLYLLFNQHTFDGTIPFYLFFMVLFTSILFGGLEEIGWRGFLQERLAKRKNLVMISLLIGVLWGLWHVPLFFIEDVSHYTFKFLPFMLGAMMFSTYLTWLYAKTNSILLAVLFHASINASATIGLRLVFNHSLLTYLLLIGFTSIGLWLLIGYERSNQDESDKQPKDINEEPYHR